MGRELDVLIAEKVMGWQWLRMDLQRWPDSEGHAWGSMRSLRPDESNGVWTLPALLDMPIHFDASHIPLYSTDIAAAWLVVERLEQITNCYVEVGWCNAEHGPQRRAWCFVAEYGNDGSNMGEAYEDTAPMAICLAGLRAVKK
jgi:hypothetical protein